MIILEVFHIKKAYYLEAWGDNSPVDSIEGFSEENFKNTSYLEINLDNKKNKAHIILKDELFKPITGVIEDDWYAIMDNIHEGKWLGKYTLAYK